MDWHKILHVIIFLKPFSSSKMGKFWYLPYNIKWQKINFQMDWHNILYMVIFLQPFSSSKMGNFWYLPYKIKWQYNFLLMGSFWNFTHRIMVLFPIQTLPPNKVLCRYIHSGTSHFDTHFTNIFKFILRDFKEYLQRSANHKLTIKYPLYASLRGNHH